MRTGIFAIFSSLELDGAVFFPNCMGFVLGGGAGGLPVLGSSFFPDRTGSSLGFCFMGDIRAAFEVRPPVDSTGIGRRVSPPARLGSSFFNTADTIPDGFGADVCAMGALSVPNLLASHSSSKWVLHIQFFGWAFNSVRE